MPSSIFLPPLRPPLLHLSSFPQSRWYRVLERVVTPLHIITPGSQNSPFILTFLPMYKFPMSLLSFQSTSILLSAIFSGLLYRKPFRNLQSIYECFAHAVGFFPSACVVRQLHLLMIMTIIIGHFYSTT